jgi:uncharacterized metal-binding protein
VNARGHTTTNTIGAIALSAVASVFVDHGLVMIAAGAMLLGDLFLSPDLDHPAGYRALWRRGPWRWLWYPYSRAFRHRSPFSHWPLLGTLSRGLWASLVGILACWLAGMGPSELYSALSEYRSELLAGVVGLELSGSLHFLADRG